MSPINVHEKQLPVPSFFQVYNFGGGNGDKDREIVYAEITGNTPALLNYYYINNNYPHSFQNKLFDNPFRYRTIGDLYNEIRQKLIEKGEIYSEYDSPEYDFNQKVFLLDSGAFNIIKQIAESVDYDINRFYEVMPEHISAYYDFANSLNFDIVVGFDFGGKYTEKDGEGENERLQAFLAQIDVDEFNRFALRKTIEYLSAHRDYYPYVMATVHGNTPEEYELCTREILTAEETAGIQFWGFALGGIASYKQADESWFNNIDFRGIGKRGFKETVIPAKACRIVRTLVGNRPIHALGCGGYNNIALNYYCGATSFDAASPVRRVGDGNTESTHYVFDPRPSKKSFSKYFIGGLNMDGNLREQECKYVKINEVPDDMPLCGCTACLLAETVNNIKTLYSLKETDSEACYYSRQLMGLHAVLQHRKLCEIVANYHSMDEFATAYPSTLNTGLQRINEQL